MKGMIDSQMRLELNISSQLLLDKLNVGWAQKFHSRFAIRIYLVDDVNKDFQTIQAEGGCGLPYLLSTPRTEHLKEVSPPHD